MMAAALFGVLAWFFLMVPICQSAWILSKGGKRLVGPHLLLAAVSWHLLGVVAHLVGCTIIIEFSLIVAHSSAQ